MQPERESARDSVAFIVCEVLADAMRRDPAEIGLDQSLVDELGLDSIATMEVAIELEQRLHVTFPDFTAPHELGLHTVRDLVEMTRARVAAHAE